ncbi:MAG TPA: dTMP kinase [Polyangiaceae bacterium]|nr:dTMP kinase [Polyangiaceae bacterium]
MTASSLSNSRLSASSGRFPGLFVVVEGIDGCGSTTHAKLLAQALERGGREVVLTCEPSTGPVGVLIRQALQHRLFASDGASPRTFDWRTMALLFAADRMDHLEFTVTPALRSGSVVISDRYDLSSLAYQSVTAHDGSDPIPWIRQLNAQALRPDVTIVIDVPAEVAEERRRVRGGVEEMFEARELQARLATVYARAEELVPQDRVLHVSGVGEMAEIAARVLETVISAASGYFQGLNPAQPVPEA